MPPLFRTQPDDLSHQGQTDMTRPPLPALPARTPRRQPHPPPGRLRLHECTRRGVLTPHRATTLPTTLAKTRSLSARDPHSTSHTAVRPAMMSDSRQLSTVMTATLSAEMEGRVPADLAADLVRAVLDESRRSAHDRGVEPSMAEARQRLERFVRARSSV